MSDEDMKVPEKVSTALAGWAEAKSDLERESALYHALRRERNYKILQAAAVIYGAAIQHGLDEEQVKKQKRPFEVFVNDALALLEEIEGRNP